MKLKLFLICAAIGLSGCVATTPNTGQSVIQNDPTNSCFANMANDRAYAPLNAIVGLPNKPESITLEMRANKRPPTAEEKQVLSSWYSARIACYDLGRSYRASNYPAHTSQALDKHHTQFLSLIAKLHSEEITYSQFIDAREYIRQEVLSANDRGNREAAALQAQRSAAQAAQTTSTLQILQALQPPPPRLGVTCTTQRLGTVLNTQCN